MKCECFAFVLEHIPIADLATIVHDYVAVEPRADKDCIEIFINNRKYIIQFTTMYGFPNLHITKMNTKNGEDYKVWIEYGLHEHTQLCAAIFQDHEQLMWIIDSSEIRFSHKRSRGYQNIYKAQLLECIKVAYQILSAEETGDHFHPDPRIASTCE